MRIGVPAGLVLDDFGEDLFLEGCENVRIAEEFRYVNQNIGEESSYFLRIGLQDRLK